MTQPSNIASRELRELLGDADDLMIERVIDTGASLDEVVEALAGLEDERNFDPRNRDQPSARAGS